MFEGGTPMQNCLLHNKEISLLSLLKNKEYQVFKENELMLRSASKNKELICLDCGSILTYKHIENIVAHLSHYKGTAHDCDYSEYTSKQTEEQRMEKGMLYEYFQKLYRQESIRLQEEQAKQKQTELFTHFSQRSSYNPTPQYKTRYSPPPKPAREVKPLDEIKIIKFQIRTVLKGKKDNLELLRRRFARSLEEKKEIEEAFNQLQQEGFEGLENVRKAIIYENV